MDIVCLPGVLYDKFPLTNRQQIMNRLAGAHRVLFVEQPKSPIVQAAKLVLGKYPEQRPAAWFGRTLSIEERRPHLYLHPLVEYLPEKNRALRRWNYRINAGTLRQRIRELGFKDYVLWIYTPDALPLVDLLEPSLVCYDCVDEYTQQPYYRSHFDGLDRDERELLATSDIVFVSAPSLYNSKRRHNANVYLTPNVGDYEHFAKAQSPSGATPPDLEGLVHPIIGFVGALDSYKVDFGLIEYVSRSQPEWSIVLIGPAGQAERPGEFPLAHLPNVHWLGPRDYADLPRYLGAFDVCTIPYVLNDYTRGCFPLKFHEFLATGKPVVCTALPALVEYHDIACLAADHEEFLQAIRSSLDNDTPASRARRIVVASQNTWESKASRMMEIIKEQMPQSTHSPSHAPRD